MCLILAVQRPVFLVSLDDDVVVLSRDRGLQQVMSEGHGRGEKTAADRRDHVKISRVLGSVYLEKTN